MKFKDLKLGNILETSNEFVIKQYKNNPNRYEEVKEETTKRRKKSDE